MARDRKAEYAARNAKAVSEGFRSYYDYRHAYETGIIAPIRPKQVRSSKTVAAQERRLANIKPPKTPKSAQKPTDYAGLAPKITKAQRAQDWSNLFARAEEGLYLPRVAADLGVTKAAYTQAYLNAWVIGETRYKHVRHAGGSEYLFYWMVTLNHFMESEEYEKRYGNAR